MVKRTVAILLCAVFLAQAFCGCSSSTGVIRMDIGGPVENLDPQYATDPTSRMILANIFEGLLVKNPDGTVRPGAAREYEVSPDGLTYTFTLREDARWEDGEPVSSQDFLFAFQRMFTPNAPSPYAEEFSAISGAEQVMSGALPMSRLGVSAPEPSRLVFTLERQCPDFPQRLASTAAAPCNRRVFEESKGRYGLEITFVYSNGPFILERWDNSRYLFLDRGEYYRDNQTATPERVILYIGRDDPVMQFLDGKSDLVLLPSDSVEAVSERRAQLLPIQRTTWCLVFNQDSAPWGNPLLRQSLALTLDKSLYAGSLASNLTAAGVLLPPATAVDGKSYRGAVGGNPPLGYDPERGRHLLGLGLDALGQDRFPQTVAYVPEAGDHKLYMGLIQQGWQRELAVQINVMPATPQQMQDRLLSGDYHLMLVPLTPADDSPGSLLREFCADSAKNYYGYRNPRFDQTLDTASASSGEAARLYKAAEDILLEDAAFIPLYFETTYYALATGLTGVELSPFGAQILFYNAAKA